MRILIAAPGFDEGSRHELNIFALDQAKALRGMGHEVRLAAVDTRSVRHRRPWGFRQYELEGIPVYYGAVPCGRLPLPLASRAEKAAANGIWRRVTGDGWRPEVIHQHFGTEFSGVAHRNGVPFVYTEHRSWINRPLPEKARRILKKQYESADALLCVSHMLEQSILDNTGLRATVVSNVVDAELFLPTHPAESTDVFRFVSCGSLTHRKGYDILLRAMGRLVRSGREAELTIYGDGEEMAALRALAEKEHLAEKVHFMGQATRQQLAEGYAGADAFVLASRRETFGVVYIEAMASGLPVIATRCGGPEDFVAPEYGYLIPADDEDALLSAMEEMILHRRDFDGNTISAFARGVFSPREIASRLTAEYEKLIK